jgi:hypothetical protein
VTKQLTVGDAFIGYHTDAAAAIVMQICNNTCGDQDRKKNQWASEVVQT